MNIELKNTNITNIKTTVGFENKTSQTDDGNIVNIVIPYTDIVVEFENEEDFVTSLYGCIDIMKLYNFLHKDFSNKMSIQFCIELVKEFEFNIRDNSTYSNNVPEFSLNRKQIGENVFLTCCQFNYDYEKDTVTKITLCLENNGQNDTMSWYFKDNDLDFINFLIMIERMASNEYIKTAECLFREITAELWNKKLLKETEVAAKNTSTRIATADELRRVINYCAFWQRADLKCMITYNTLSYDTPYGGVEWTRAIPYKVPRTTFTKSDMHEFRCVGLF